MATTQIAIAANVWTLVAAAETNGYITSNAALPIIFGVFTSLPGPTSSVGHIMPKDGFNFSVGTGEALYAKSAGYSTSVIVTVNTSIDP